MHLNTNSAAFDFCQLAGTNQQMLSENWAADGDYDGDGSLNSIDNEDNRTIVANGLTARAPRSDADGYDLEKFALTYQPGSEISKFGYSIQSKKLPCVIRSDTIIRRMRHFMGSVKSLAMPDMAVPCALATLNELTGICNAAPNVAPIMEHALIKPLVDLNIAKLICSRQPFAIAYAKHLTALLRGKFQNIRQPAILKGG
ncbi:hypothetical protein [Sphingorhabdus contaminans]|uniref:Uncharacterized protein n=1 Tax=Sphingorhabdus contaminans TaxID=1343899 RepID=A0A553WJP6_9SPHN|nr:hypothetical protein [Sphingorhabdus contaminans]TSB04947.1 hypothetical protein FOM92_06030 [Sphingorhabdus contaminans]